jgi:hypothetical protein
MTDNKAEGTFADPLARMTLSSLSNGFNVQGWDEGTLNIEP